MEVTRGWSLAVALIPLALVVVGRRGHRWAVAAGSSSPSADPTHILRPPLVPTPLALCGRRRGWSSVCLGRAVRGVEGLGMGVVSDGGSRITATLTQGSDTPSLSLPRICALLEIHNEKRGGLGSGDDR